MNYDTKPGQRRAFLSPSAVNHARHPPALAWIMPSMATTQTDTLTPDQIIAMVDHWLRVPVGGILGSDYGSNLYDYLHRPLAEMRLEEWVDKMRFDLPILTMLPDEAVQVAYDTDGVQLASVSVRVVNIELVPPEMGG